MLCELPVRVGDVLDERTAQNRLKADVQGDRGDVGFLHDKIDANVLDGFDVARYFVLVLRTKLHEKDTHTHVVCFWCLFAYVVFPVERNFCDSLVL